MTLGQTMARRIEQLRPRAEFLIHCDRKKRGKYYLVIIMRRRSDVPRAARIVTGSRHGWRKTVGFCHAVGMQKKYSHGWRETRLAGVVILAASCIGGGYVSHELTHAAHFRVTRQFKNAAIDDDRVIEPLADMQGWLVAQFWTEFYRRFPGAAIQLREP